MAELTFESTKKIVDTKDYRIQINEAGEGYPIYMLHGTGPGATGWSNFAPNIAELSKKYRCIAVTMPGWGESSPQTVETGRDHVEAMRQLSDTLGIDKAAFVGNSMGGNISIRFTALHPDRISHLVTMGSGAPGVNMFQAGGMTEGIRILVEAYEDPSPENFKRIVKIMCYDSSFASDEIAEQRSKTAHEFPEHNKNWLEFFRATQGVMAGLDILPQLAVSTVPALIIHGRDDRTVHFESSMRLVSLIPNSRLVLFNHCAHWAQLEHAAEFNRLVDGFISNSH